MRVFLDTNVLVAALATRGLCRDLLAQLIWTEEPLVGTLVVAEATRVLTTKLGLPAGLVARQLRVLTDYYVDCPTIDAKVEVRDATDADIVRCAIACSADVLVSGDRDLLEAALPIRVASPRELWQTLRHGLDPDTVHEPAAMYEP